MFASNKIVSILLYIIFGVSVLIVAFFYFGDNLLDEAAYNAKVAKLEAPEESYIRPVTVEQEGLDADSLAIDSLGIDSAAVIAPVVPMKPAEPVKVSFTFYEKLIYYKTDIALGWAYILLGITLILSLIFPLIHMFSNPKSIVQTLGILAAAAVVVGIASLFASDTPMNIPGFVGTDNSNPGVLKFVDTAIYTTYFLIGLALISILYSEISKYFK